MFDSIFSWEAVYWILMVVYVPVCIGLIVVVLLQKGKGAGFAGAFGLGGGSDTVFGPRGSKSVPVRLTQIMAGLFMAIALILSVISGRMYGGVAPEKEDPSKALMGLEDLGIQGAASSATTAGESSPAAAPIQVELPKESTAPAAPQGS